MLLPANHGVQPFEDSSGLLESPGELRERAAASGFLFLGGLLPASLVAAVRGRARDAFAAQRWVRPAADNPPIMDAVPGARLEGGGWDDPRWLDIRYEPRSVGEASILRPPQGRFRDSRGIVERRGAARDEP